MPTKLSPPHRRLVSESRGTYILPRMNVRIQGETRETYEKIKFDLMEKWFWDMEIIGFCLYFLSLNWNLFLFLFIFNFDFLP